MALAPASQTDFSFVFGIVGMSSQKFFDLGLDAASGGEEGRAAPLLVTVHTGLGSRG